MAARTLTEKIAVSLKLNNGTSTTGKVKTVSLNVGKLDKATFDADKALTIAGLIGACLSKSVYEVQKTETSQLLN